MNSFNALGLSAPLLEAVQAVGFETPTLIQQIAIPHLLQGETDLIALAQTGTGKTAAFGLPLIDLVDPSDRDTQALILAPTRELALQITTELQRFAAAVPGLHLATVYGGADIRRQIREVERGAQVIVATPGRLKDLMERGRVQLAAIRFVVLDEADEMLNMGFRPDIDFILDATPATRRTWLFSATMSKEVERLSKRYLHSPKAITAGARNESNKAIDHQYLLLRRSEKYDALRRLLDYHEGFYGLLFCRTRRDTQQLAEQLAKDGYQADALHGDMNQSQRERVMARFRRRRLRILVATDVAARGIDVDDLTHVLHYNIPDDVAFYTHRSGRTGRAGKEGTSIALLTKGDLSLLRQVERHSQVKFERIDLPERSAVLRKRLRHHFKAIAETPVNTDLQPLLGELSRELAHLSKEELIARLASQVIADLPPATDTAKASDPNRPRNGKHRGDFRATRLFINVGSMDGYDKAALLRLVCEHADIPGSAVGKIEVAHKHSHIEVEEPVAGAVMQRFRDTHMEGRPLRVNPADGGKAGKKMKGKRKQRSNYRP